MQNVPPSFRDTGRPGGDDQEVPGYHLWALYHEYLRLRHRSPATITAYRHCLLRFWAFIAPKRPLRAEPKDLDRFLSQASKGRGGQGGPVLSGTTRSVYAAIVCRFYTWAAAEELTPRDRMAKFIPPRRPEPADRDLMPEHVAQLLDYLGLVGDPRVTVMVWLAFAAALRVGEIAHLRVDDIHLRRDPPWMLVHGKGGRQRKVPVSPMLRAVLRSYLAIRPRTGPLLPDLRQATRNIGPRHVSRLLAETMRAAGLTDTGHALRHTFATWTLEAGDGQNIRGVSKILGHVDLRTTERYVQGYTGDAAITAGLLRDPRDTKPVRRGSEGSRPA